MKKLLLLTLLIGCGGGSGGSAFFFFGGFWTGQLILIEDSCDLGVSDILNIRHTINQDEERVVVDTGFFTVEGTIVEEDNQFVAIGRGAPDINGCTSDTAIVYGNANGDTAQALVEVEVTCPRAGTCRVDYFGNVRR